MIKADIFKGLEQCLARIKYYISIWSVSTKELNLFHSIMSIFLEILLSF